MRRHPNAVHILILSLLATASLVFLLGGRADVAHALGRNENLARMDIWEAIIPMGPNPLVGAGFESFWVSPTVQGRLAVLFPNLPLNEAHDGYIEVYLQLGWAGLVLIGFILTDGYRRAVKAFRREPALGSLLLAFSLVMVFYNITEAGFRMLNPIWIFYLLAVIQASNIAADVTIGASSHLGASSLEPYELPARIVLAAGPARRALPRKTVRPRST